MKWNYKRVLGLGFPVFVFAISFYVYYVVIYPVFTQFYAANGYLWLSVILGIFFHAIFIMFLWSYIACTFSDAGSVPARLRQPKTNTDVGGAMKYCDRCQAFKPDRCHHCSTCEECVLKMDHHCPWVNNCVGYNNYKYFVQFLFYATLVCAYTFCSLLHRAIVGIRLMGIGMGDALPGSIHVLVACMITAAFTLGVGFLLAAHVRLTLNNKTTLEDFDNTPSPYDLGPRRNFASVFGHNRWGWVLPLQFRGDADGDGTMFPREPVPPEAQRLTSVEVQE